MHLALLLMKPLTVSSFVKWILNSKMWDLQLSHDVSGAVPGLE